MEAVTQKQTDLSRSENAEKNKNYLKPNISQRLSAEHLKANETYRKKMAVVVRRNVHAFSQFQVSASEQLDTAKTWSELLCGTIPENRLMEIWQSTFDNHKSDFPITAVGLKKTWELVCETEAAEKLKAEIREREVNPILICEKVESHFEGEFNGEKFTKADGSLVIALGFNEPEQVMPCEKCRPAAYAQFLERRKTKPIAAEIVDKILNPPRSEIQKLDAEIERLGKEARNGNGKSHKEWLKLIEKRADL